jgi:hypothetical protein
MVSDGPRSTLWAPLATRLGNGQGETEETSMEPFATLRPNVIYYALLLQPIDPQNEIAVLEQDDSQSVMGSEARALVQQRNYAVNIIAKDGLRIPPI